LISGLKIALPALLFKRSIAQFKGSPVSLTALEKYLSEDRASLQAQG
jgi:hypothetical protein